MKKVLIIALVFFGVTLPLILALLYFFPVVKVDVANSCGWESSKIISTTKNPSKIESQRMSRSTYDRYMQAAQFNFKCVVGSGLW